MKRIILISFMLISVYALKAQQLSYAYEAAGNRVSRTIGLDTRSTSASVNESDTVFFEEILAEKQIKIYPNPVESVLTILISDYTPSMEGEFSLLNMGGMMLNRRRITAETTYVEMSRYPKGIYVLYIQLRGQLTSWKVIKK
jgi:hypothetical protein